MRNPLTKLFLWLNIAIFITSCSSHKENNGLSNPVGIPYTIDLTQFIEKPDGLKGISSIADSITYVVLRTNPDEPMDQIRKVILRSKYIFIIDSESSIFIFNHSGKFIRKINHRGRGPGEYYAPLFTFNDYNAEIVIWAPGKVLFYNVDDSLLKTLKIKENLQNFRWLDKDLYLLKQFNFGMESDTSAISSFVINSNGDLVASHKYFVKEKPPLKRSGGIEPCYFVTYNEGILISEPYNDTIYLINHDGLRLPFSIYNFGSHKAPREVIEGLPPIQLREDMKYIRQLSNFIFSKYALVRFYYQGVIYQGIWDFNKEKAMTFSVSEASGGIEDDIDSGLPCRLIISYGDDFNGLVLDIINPMDLLMSKSIKPRRGSDLEKIKNNLTIYDDPILRIIHLKTKIE